MPRGDRTGPNGAGEMTGRARGYCAGYGEPGYTDNFGRGGGFGRGGRGRFFTGRGRGAGFFGYGRPFHAGAAYPQAGPYTAADEAEDLKAEMKGIEERMQYISRRLGEINTEKGE